VLKLQRNILFCVCTIIICSPINYVFATDQFITIASTTSTQDSGFFKFILPIFKSKTGVDVRVIAQGTGQALETAKRGDVDVVFVHDKAAEEQFVVDGFGVERHEVMNNDFVLIGPITDSAKIASTKDANTNNAAITVITAITAFKRIAQTQSSFVSRGDKSGTHSAELRFWQIAGINPVLAKHPAKTRGSHWYKETGSGMGPTLNTASAMNAYTLADRATWLAFKNRADLKILLEGDANFTNPYGIILVNPKKHPHVKAQLGQSFISWIISTEGQKAIADFKIEGKTSFIPNYKK
jgi:tungstate transport system substrate-binding protein